MAKKATPKYCKMIEKYCKDITSGKIDACKWVKLAVKRHLSDLKKSKTKSFKFEFDQSKAEKFCVFFSQMHHVKGEWAKGKDRRIKMEPWQAFAFGVPFGWVYKEDKTRKYRELLYLIPRKNAKSTAAAIVGNYLLTADGEQGAEILCGAGSVNQAMKVFEPAWLMTNNNKEYADYYGLELSGTKKNPGKIYNLGTSSYFDTIIGNPGDGDNPHGAILDECHEDESDISYSTMKTGQGSRLQPMLIQTSTAGKNISVPFYGRQKDLEQVLDGLYQNDELWGVIYGIDEGDDWLDFKVWKKANPNFGVSIYEKFLKARYLETIQTVSRQNDNLCKHLNKWQNAGNAWMNLDKLAKCSDKTLNIQDFAGVPCMAAIDLASKIDILSRILLFPFNDMIYCFGRHYLPADTINQKENKHYQDWRDEGYIVEMDGAVADYKRVEQELLDDNKKYPIQLLGYDPSEATHLIQTIAAELGEDKCVEINQGPNQMSEPMKELEADIYSGKFVYGDDPVLTWMFSNTIIKQAKGGGPVKKYYPTKDRVSAKIDGVVALIMARKMTMTVAPVEKSFWETMSA